MTKTIYVATAGSYSDYHIVGVYDNRELAEKAGDVEEYPLNPYADELNAGLHMFYVTLGYDTGDVRSFGPTDELSTPPRHIAAHPRLWPESFGGCLWAKDRDHAIKIVNEKRLQHKAGQGEALR